MATDFDLGSGSIVVSAKRDVYRIDWHRDKPTKTETAEGFISQTNTNKDTDVVLSVENYLVRLTDTVIKGCDGHNKFLNDMKALINQCVTEFKASGSVIDPTSGSVEVLT